MGPRTSYFTEEIILDALGWMPKKWRPGYHTLPYLLRNLQLTFALNLTRPYLVAQQ